MATLCTPPPSVLHSTHRNFKHFDEMDNLEVIKSQVDLLTLNEVSRNEGPGCDMARKRRRPSFLIALLDPFNKNKKGGKEFGISGTPKRKMNRKKSHGIPIELSPLLDEFDTEDDYTSTKSYSRPQFRFGSTQSLCSQKSYQMRQRNMFLDGLKRIRFNKQISRTTGKEECPKKIELATADISNGINKHIEPKPQLCRTKSDVYNSRDCAAKMYQFQPPTMTLCRSPRGHKCDSGVYVQLTRSEVEEKSAEILSLKKNAAPKSKTSCSSVENKGNALDILMTWLQRKSPESSESSPTMFRRRASVSGRPSRGSRRARSSTRGEGKGKSNSKSPESEDKLQKLNRRNSFSSGRRSLAKKISKPDISQNDENAKPSGPCLEEMLRNKVAVQAFREFLRTEFSEENLDFWLEVEAYKSLKASKKFKAAGKIFAEFLANSAPREVNIDFETRLRTEERLKNPDEHTFDEPQNCIYSLMKCDSFRRFLVTESFLNLVPTDVNKNEQETDSRKKLHFKNNKKKKSPR